MPSAAKSFFWYELMTTDMDAAEAFYAKVVGWSTEPFNSGPEMPRYTIMKAGDRGVGGVMNLPAEAAKMGMPPAWMGYIHADDTDAATASVKKSGGKVHREPWDIPGVGRYGADPYAVLCGALDFEILGTWSAFEVRRPQQGMPAPINPFALGLGKGG